MVNTLDDLQAINVDFVSVTEPFDTSVPSGKLLLHLVSAMSEFERALIRERTKAGLAATAKRGTRLGRPPKPVDIERVLELRRQGMSDRAIAKELNVARATLARALKPKA